ncbi:MAG: hypothetical protein ACPGQL_04730 [Thermoplasmatota archaeon]
MTSDRSRAPRLLAFVALAACATLLAAPATADAWIRQDVAASLGAQAPAATLRPGPDGTVTVNQDGTSADVTVASLPPAAHDVLSLTATEPGWTARIELVELTGATWIDRVRLQLVDDRAETHIELRFGTLRQTTGPATPLEPGNDLTVRINGYHVGRSDLDLQADLVLERAGIEIAYRMDLTLGRR